MNVPPEILIEDLGDSDSSSTPLIATKSAFKGPDLSPILKMEHLPQSENESSNNDQDGGEDNGECNQAQNTSEIKTDPTKKNISSLIYKVDIIDLERFWQRLFLQGMSF